MIAIWREHASWGARKIQAVMKMKQTDGQTVVPAASTIGSILKRNGLAVRQKPRPSARPRSEPMAHATEANRVWCADFKGWFRTGDGQRIDPLTITDAWSRYILRCQAVKEPDTAHSRPVFEAAFREYGLPERIRTDNGPPFAASGDTGLTALSVWWITLGIVPERINPGKPQQNGRHERMHRTLKQETARPLAANRRRQQERFDSFRQEFNQLRPHEALGQKTPQSFYAPSQRQYPARPAAISYPDEWTVRMVSPGGQMRWKCDYVFIAHPLAGEPAGLEPLGDKLWRVWFSSYDIGVFDETAGRIFSPQKWESRRRAAERKGRV